MRNTRMIPAVVMLIAGLITTVTLFMYQVSMQRVLTILLCVLIIFYILGYTVRKIFERYLIVTKDQLLGDDETESEDDEADFTAEGEEDNGE